MTGSIAYTARYLGLYRASKFRPRGGGKTGHCGGHWPSYLTEFPHTIDTQLDIEGTAARFGVRVQEGTFRLVDR